MANYQVNQAFVQNYDSDVTVTVEMWECSQSRDVGMQSESRCGNAVRVEMWECSQSRDVGIQPSFTGQPVK